MISSLSPDFHLDPLNRRAHTPWLDMVRIVHCANPSRLGQSVNLQHRNTEHGEILLRLRSERGRPADQGLQYSRPTIFFRIAGKTTVLASHSQDASPVRGRFSFRRIHAAFGARVNRMRYAAFLPNLFIHAAPHALEQLRHIQK